MQVKIKKLSPDAVIPKYQTEGASGFDVHALESSTVCPYETRLIPTGLSFEVPKGYELQIRPRSGMSLKTRLRIANSPGTVDSDYRGHVQIIIDNLDGNYVTIAKGDRIAQGVIVPVEHAEFIEVGELNETERNQGAFGSTGK